MLQWLHEKGDWSKLSKETRESVWSLAGNGWRKVYRQFAESRVNSLNTPNHENIRRLMSTTVGMSEFSSNWGTGRWSKEDYATRLDRLLDVRHRIAHGALGDETVGKQKAKDATKLVRRLAQCMVAKVDNHIAGLDLNDLRPKRGKKT